MLYNDVLVARTGIRASRRFDANNRFNAFDIVVES